MVLVVAAVALEAAPVDVDHDRKMVSFWMRRVHIQEKTVLSSNKVSYDIMQG